MTVNSNSPISGPSVADGENTLWPFTFKVVSADHMSLYITEADGTNGVTVTDNFSIAPEYLNNDAGGYIDYPVSGPPVPDGYLVFAVRNVPYTQPNRFGNQGPYWPQTHENTFDLLAMQIQQLNEEVGRALIVPVGDDPVPIDQLRTWAEQAQTAAGVAQGAAVVAVGGAELSEEWAAGTQPGGPGTQSSREWAQVSANAALGVVVFGPFMGDGMETDFTLPIAPPFNSNVNVFLDGVWQTYGARTIDGTTLSFVAPVPNGVIVSGFIITMNVTEIGVPDPGSVTAESIDGSDAENIRLVLGAANDEDVVKHIPQVLAPQNQLDARLNIAAASDEEVVKIVAQSLDPVEQAIARANINTILGANVDAIARFIKTANQTSTSNAWADVTGMALAVEAGETWLFEGLIIATMSNSANQTEFGFNGPAFSAFGFRRGRAAGSSPGYPDATITAYDTGNNFALQDQHAYNTITGYVTFSAAGTLSARMRRALGSAGTATINSMSSLTMYRVRP